MSNKKKNSIITIAASSLYSSIQVFIIKPIIFSIISSSIKCFAANRKSFFLNFLRF